MELSFSTLDMSWITLVSLKKLKKKRDHYINVLHNAAMQCKKKPHILFQQQVEHPLSFQIYSNVHVS